MFILLLFNPNPGPILGVHPLLFSLLVSVAGLGFLHGVTDSHWRREDLPAHLLMAYIILLAWPLLAGIMALSLVLVAALLPAALLAILALLAHRLAQRLHHQPQLHPN